MTYKEILTRLNNIECLILLDEVNLESVYQSLKKLIDDIKEYEA